MEFVNRYLQCRYVDGGRGPEEYDCWGLVRTVRHEELGLRLLPAYSDLRNDNPREFTRAYLEQSAMMEISPPEHGCIASVMRGKICVHVAVVLEYQGRLRILEINPVRGARFMLLSDWVRDHLSVTYHKEAP